MVIKKNLFIVLITMIITSFYSVFAHGNSRDPFIQQWKYFDGVNSYVLTINKSNAPGQDYRIDYTFPGGSTETDMCKVISNTSFSCNTGEMLVRDDVNYLVKLTSRADVYTFYDPAHMPDNDMILGSWVMKGRYDDARYQISIMKGKDSSEYNVLTSYSDNRGNLCRYGQPDAYHVTKNADGTMTLSRYQCSFKYDPLQQKITNSKPGQDFYAGTCIELVDEGQILFTKEK